MTQLTIALLALAGLALFMLGMCIGSRHRGTGYQPAPGPLPPIPTTGSGVRDTIEERARRAS